MKNESLYTQILTRRSIRRYEPRPLSADDLARLQVILDNLQSLDRNLVMKIKLYNLDKDLNLVDLVGAYGHLVSPPHMLVPVVPAVDHTLTEQGYRLQQVCIHLLALGIGSCFVGSLGRQKELQQKLDLPDDNLSGALLALGYPAQSFTGGTFNLLVRRAAGSHQRLSVEKLFFNDSFSNPSLPPDSLSNFIEAGRASPSAVNAQPWRFLWKSGIHV